MRPQPRARISGSAAAVVWNADERLMAMIAFQRAVGKSSIGETNWMPALLTRMSTPPKTSAALVTRPRQASGSDMSAWM